MELQPLARLLVAARGPATVSELANEAFLVSAVSSSVRRSLEPAAVSSRRRGRIVKVVSAKVAVISAVVVLGGGVAAAATGSLPSPVQRVVSSGLHQMGISVPNPSSHAHGGSDSGPPTSNVHSHQLAVLCGAYQKQASKGASQSTSSFEQLRRRASSAGETVSDYCAGISSGQSSSVAQGSKKERGHNGRGETGSSDGTVPVSSTTTSLPGGSSVPTSTNANGNSSNKGSGGSSNPGKHRGTKNGKKGGHGNTGTGQSGKGSGNSGSSSGKGHGSTGSGKGKGSGKGGTGTSGTGTTGAGKSGDNHGGGSGGKGNTGTGLGTTGASHGGGAGGGLGNTGKGPVGKGNGDAYLG